jgi:hypothetical protein
MSETAARTCAWCAYMLAQVIGIVVAAALCSTSLVWWCIIYVSLITPVLATAPAVSRRITATWGRGDGHRSHAEYGNR